MTDMLQEGNHQERVAKFSPTRRILLIGLDGATFDILQPMMDQGRMPNLKAFMARGASGILMSTVPPITPAAWTTFMTGKGPGRHGIFDFERYNVRTNELRFNSVYEIKERTLWDILGEQGLRVGSLQVPMTYPPRRVNGFLVTGFETPGTDTQFTWPAELKSEILSRWPDFTFKTRWRRKTFGGLKVFRQNLAAINRSFDQGAELAKYCGEKYGWDVMMVLYKLVDNLQHKTWKYLDPRTAHRDPSRARLSAECFAHLDRNLGELFEYAVSRDASVLIMSDHGHGSLDGKVQPNLVLRQWGYLGVDRSRQTQTRARHLLLRRLRRSKGKFAANYGIEHDLAIDWPTTRAFVAHAGMCGFLYVNLKGRQQTGVVEPGEYDALRQELTDRLAALRVRGPQGSDIAPFEAIHTPEQLYKCQRDEYPWLPDLMLVPRPGLAVVRKVRGSKPVIWSSYRKLEGTHRMEGILLAAGHNIRQTRTLQADIVDITPTVLAALGLKVPSDMEGRVIGGLFDQPPTVEYESASAASAVREGSEVYSEQEQAVLTQRLADLGYLE